MDLEQALAAIAALEAEKVNNLRTPTTSAFYHIDKKVVSIFFHILFYCTFSISFCL